VAVDFEVKDGDCNSILECGLAYCPLDGMAQAETQMVAHHFRIREYLNFQSKYFQTKPDDFGYGGSDIIDLVNFPSSIRNMLEGLKASGNEIRLAVWAEPLEKTCFANLGLGWEEWRPVDIQQVDRILRRAVNGRKLENAMNAHQVTPNVAHNGGNDAVGTLLVAAQLMQVVGGPKSPTLDVPTPEQEVGGA
jgi:hypothetical protein